MGLIAEIVMEADTSLLSQPTSSCPRAFLHHRLCDIPDQPTAVLEECIHFYNQEAQATSIYPRPLFRRVYAGYLCPCDNSGTEGSCRDNEKCTEYLYSQRRSSLDVVSSIISPLVSITSMSDDLMADSMNKINTAASPCSLEVLIAS